MNAKDPMLDRLFADAERAHAAGNAQAAYAALERVVAIDPDNARALNTLALRLERTDPARARSMLERAARAAPEVASIRVNLARVCRRLDDEEGEGAALDAALALDPYLLPALVACAQRHERQGRAARAARAWAAVVAVVPSPPPHAMAAVLEHARAFLAGHADRTARAIAPALDAARAGLDPDDLARFDHAVEHMLGRRAIYVHRPTGFHVPRLPADEFFERRHFAWLADLEARTDAIRAELLALLDAGGDGFAPYVAYAPGTPVNQWRELNHSDRWSAWFLWRDGVRREEACARCPATAVAIEASPVADIPGRSPTAFFSLLKPRTRIPPHTGVTNARAIVHLPLVVPPGCGFRVGSETREWRPGEAFAFDDTIEHEAWNDSDQLRAVLIFDAWNPHLGPAERAMIRALMVASDEAADGLASA